MGLINFFRRLFGRKVRHKAKHKVKHTSKHRKPHKRMKIKHKVRPKSKHKTGSKHNHKTKKPVRHHKAKAHKRTRPAKHKIIHRPNKAAKYGIPESHKHEASLKVAEKRSEIDEFYTEPKGKVTLKIMEKGSLEFEEAKKDDHDFVFKERKFRGKEKESIKKIEEIAKTARSSQLVTTKLDTILDIVNKTGKVRLDHLSQVLKIHEKKVEELAKILAKNNQIEIHYPFIGKPELKKKEAKNV